MLRKAAAGTLAVAAIGGLLLGQDVWSYARTGVCATRDYFRGEVPVEFEIERAKQEVEQLLPEVRKSMHLIAEEQVEVAQLQKSISRKETMLAGQEEAILSLTSDLKSNDTKFAYAGHRYSRHEVEKDLAERFNRFKIAEETVKRERQVLVAKETALVANRETLENMLSQRKNLEAELERLEARLATVAARKQINGLQIDDSQLNRVRALIGTIEKRLDVEDAVLAAEGDLSGLIPLERHQEEQTEADIAAAVETYFNKPSDERVAERIEK
ncbi:coiled-coil domain-containing protein [Planctomicrobium piriforme]|uniref:Uncharacterized protein n=1 Tax=Planctomicrobium piriforme TaxID=1576369 RepID=A0A1I3F7Q0_9PLAN|nr:hypothetical protein [Planctomicrobium piriforme]SFI07245.1 hypothetical protein SAMN05421753_105117 [Planctomicrobium piriforme]